jgi:hypothetical protein
VCSSALVHYRRIAYGTTIAESGGLTVVYGDNASGKSGYARLVKKVVPMASNTAGEVWFSDTMSFSWRRWDSSSPTMAPGHIWFGGGDHLQPQLKGGVSTGGAPANGPWEPKALESGRSGPRRAKILGNEKH